MTNPSHSDILRRRRKVEDSRREKQQELMREYDEEVVRPARQSLQAECEAIGHEFEEWRSNGIGGAWRFCRYCDKGEFEPWADVSTLDAPITAAADGADRTDTPTQNES